MKKIIIETMATMPATCNECKCREVEKDSANNLTGDLTFFCGIEGKEITDVNGKRPSFCPLREIEVPDQAEKAGVVELYTSEEFSNVYKEKFLQIMSEYTAIDDEKKPVVDTDKLLLQFFSEKTFLSAYSDWISLDDTVINFNKIINSIQSKSLSARIKSILAENGYCLNFHLCEENKAVDPEGPEFWSFVATTINKEVVFYGFFFETPLEENTFLVKTGTKEGGDK